MRSRAEITGDRKRVALELTYQALPEMSMRQSLVSLDAPLGEWLLAAAFPARIPDNDTKLLLVKAEN